MNTNEIKINMDWYYPSDSLYDLIYNKSTKFCVNQPLKKEQEMSQPLIQNIAIDLLLEKYSDLEVYSCQFENSLVLYSYIGRKGLEKDSYVVVPENKYKNQPSIAKVFGTTKLDLTISNCYKFLVGTVDGGKYDFSKEKEDYLKIVNDLKAEKERSEKVSHYNKAGFELEQARKIAGLGG